ncbi:Uracil DNA glycosylase superfamily protein [Posidoniimonas polymericola]|uniref:Type-4 uracil-DNA glycosylase n=1 Tax=Posidoniimonas polymericola TaxID=2528002 RepID=A0A5C5YQU4_9BACT|nr:uracil-DNA glycosylase [Posidoniimonas polymericola]TWT77120.1 Uracil DNA glycosylase superfamily protein [Posidoniimonas polymericola]
MDQPDYRRALEQCLEGLLAAGVRQLPRSTAPLTLQETAAEPAPSPSTGQTTIDPPLPAAAAQTPAALPASVTAAPTLDVLQGQVADCRRCDELARTRTQTVFGVGDPNARLCFMGEAPGADEDRQGEPFVGRAGQLLDKIIQACRMQRSEVYILNTLKCRPPGNRNPKPEEAANCSGFLNRQLELIDPEFICCLGAVAAQSLLQTQTPIGRLRGGVHDYRGIKVVCTYHPAYLLRNPAAKKDAWDDMKMLMSLMGVEL